MQLMSFIHSLRQKPKRVRERIVLLSVVAISPVIFFIWFFTAHYGDAGTGAGTVDTVKSVVSGTFGNPAYQDTFGTTKSQ